MSRVRVPEGVPKVGVFNDEGPPVPIPNTAVKLIRADNTCMATCREDRSMPTQKGVLQNENFCRTPFFDEKNRRKRQNALPDVEREASESAIILTPMRESVSNIENHNIFRLCSFLYPGKMASLTMSFGLHPVLLKVKCQSKEKQFCLYVLLSCCQKSAEAEIIL